MIVRFRQCFWTRIVDRRGVQLREQISQRDPVDVARFLQRFKRGNRASDAVHAVIHQDACCEGPLQQDVGDRRARRQDSSSLFLSIDPNPVRRCASARTDSLSIGYVFGNHHEGVRLGEDDSLPAALDDAALFPGAEKPADGEQRRSGHLGDILS